MRWDRVGRLTLLLVLVGVLALYIGPARSYIASWQQSEGKQAVVKRLETENAALKAQKARLNSPVTLEREARRLGMVRAGEQPYVISRTR